MSLVARELEAAGIPTVILGSALDIVEHCGVPRFVFTDFPLGNPCGKPWETDMQRSIVGAALDLFSSAQAPRSTVVQTYNWGSDTWRSEYMEIREEDRAMLLQKGAENRQRRAEMRARREANHKK